MSAENAVQQYIRENGQRFVEELSELLRIPSISAQTEHRGDMPPICSAARSGCAMHCFAREPTGPK
mgnify:CR=1 FL=1